MPSPDRACILTQSDFARALLWRSGDVPHGIQGRLPGEPLKRFNVYRNNVFASLIAVLFARFPVVERLVGRDFFAAMAGVFIESSPPRSPVLSGYGGEMPGFLETFEPVRELSYLPDVARLEWAIAAAYHAADALPLAASGLAGLIPDEICKARFIFHPAVSLVASPFPIVTIWETNTHDEHVRPLRAERAGEDALVARQGFDVAVIPLAPGVAHFVAAIREGRAIEQAAGAAMAASPEFDLHQALAALFRAGALAGIQVSRTSPPAYLSPSIGA